MNAIWQNLIVLSLVAASGLYLGWRIYRTLLRRKLPGCGGCGNCPQTPAAPTPQIVALETLRKPSDAGSRV